MKRLLCLPTLLLVNASITTLVHAEDMYVGAAISRSLETTLKFSDGHDTVNFSGTNKPIPFKLLAGYNINNNFAIEAGYKNYGTSNTGPIGGAANTFSSHASAFYLAGKGILVQDESWSVYGKLGVALTRASFTGTGELSPLSSNENKARLYAGLGASYNISKNLALTLELENFGEAKGKNDLKFNMNGFSAGVKFSF